MSIREKPMIAIVPRPDFSTGELDQGFVVSLQSIENQCAEHVTSIDDYTRYNYFNTDGNQLYLSRGKTLGEVISYTTREFAQKYLPKVAKKLSQSKLTSPIGSWLNKPLPQFTGDEYIVSIPIAKVNSQIQSKYQYEGVDPKKAHKILSNDEHLALTMIKTNYDKKGRPNLEAIFKELELE